MTAKKKQLDEIQKKLIAEAVKEAAYPGKYAALLLSTLVKLDAFPKFSQEDRNSFLSYLDSIIDPKTGELRR